MILVAWKDQSLQKQDFGAQRKWLPFELNRKIGLGILFQSWVLGFVNPGSFEGNIQAVQVAIVGMGFY